MQLSAYGFALAAMGTGLDAWRLREDEAEQLGTTLADCARALPSRKFKAAEQIIGAVAPWIGLCGTLAVILTPRVQAHRAERRRLQGGLYVERGISQARDANVPGAVAAQDSDSVAHRRNVLGDFAPDVPSTSETANPNGTGLPE